MAEYLYKVREGDTILSVCLSFDIDFNEFARLNPDFDYMGHRYAGDLIPGERVIVGNTNNILDRLRIESRRHLR